MNSITNVFPQEILDSLKNLPEVLEAKEQLSSKNLVYFSIPITETIRTTLQEKLGLNLSTVSKIPLRWIKGDTPSHIDTGASAFEHTYLVYVNDSQGSFVLDSESYPITANTAFVFHEGLSHKTEGTGVEPRLLVGPMNELAEPVGSPIAYYSSEADALTYNNPLGYSGSYTVGDGGPFGPGPGYSSWRLAANSTGTSPQNVVYTNGQALNAGGSYYLYPASPCFKEGTKVLCQIDGKDSYEPIESLKIGTLVKTSRDGYKKIELIGSGIIYNPGTTERIQQRLYKCSTSMYKELTEDLYITGCHSILVDSLSPKERDDTIKEIGDIYITDKKYRLIACVDDRAEPFASDGIFNIYHLALENEHTDRNYGIYVNGGLLVETCCINRFKNKSNLVVVGL